MSSLCLDQDRLEHPAYSAIAVPSSPCQPGSSVAIGGHFEGSLAEKQAHHGTGKECSKGGRSPVTIDMLPDVALLEMFDFFIEKSKIMSREIPPWHTLVHVCQKWRNVVFESPFRLKLQLYCRAKTPVREMLDLWPPLPIVIGVYGGDTWDSSNIITALEHNDRVCELVILGLPSSETEKVLAASQQPFPALTHLHLAFYTETAPVVPASFLGGSAPGLQTLTLDRFPFPGLPKLLVSATHLVNLSLRRIPHSGYFSPEAMVTALSVLIRLESLYIGFESPRSRPEQRTRRPPPQTRTLLPLLTTFLFKGVGDYLEDVVARIDAPRLDKFMITFFHQLIFDASQGPQLTQFISRTPKFKTHNEARVEFSNLDVWVTTLDGALTFRISCKQSDWQLSSVAQVCGSSFPQALIPAVEHLYIQGNFWSPDWQDDIETSQWLELFQPFTAVKDLYISLEFAPSIAPALKELVGERVTEVLPALQTLFLKEPLPSGPVQEAIGQFVAARQLAGHPLAVSRWEREEKEESFETDD